MTTVLTEPALVAWGESIGAAAPAPRAIARGAGVEGHIPSPTYNLLFRYPATGGRDVVHIDLYRLEHEDEVWALGWSELPGPHDLVL
ncbi:MAG TPA: tRNA (adenosine(37)-N6)-threonylcarbamoyltransferase complex ATPase subunit type 1 TsaE, partial [Longimicrobiaceae bacterium]|nr:tRNA (adenosine(37)-N6)-threonylcarbamoyltransferase complex ATPase subunit type 1 TsaE [Longimicrobiaceae bacterium]